MSDRIDAESIAALAKAVLDVEDERRKRANERIVGLKRIAAELGVSVNATRALMKNHGLPVDLTPVLGYSIRRWLLDRWIDARSEAVELRFRRR